MRICENCGIEYVKSGKIFGTRYCSDCRINRKSNIVSEKIDKPKICIVCGIEYKESAYSRNTVYCSGECRKLKLKLSANKSWQKDNDKIQNHASEHKEMIVKRTFKRYESSAIKRGLKFELTIDDFNSCFQSECFYCGDKLNTIGFDRMDSKIGYIQSNIVPCCTMCNLMKYRHDADVFISQCRKIIKHTDII